MGNYRVTQMLILSAFILLLAACELKIGTSISDAVAADSFTVEVIGKHFVDGHALLLFDMPEENKRCLFYNGYQEATLECWDKFTR